MSQYNAPYTGDRLHRVAFPMGGFGAGMICLEGTGALSHVSLRHKPEVFNEPLLFGALYVKGAPAARVLEGPVPMWKAFGPAGTGNGAGGAHGLPRFAEAEFTARFPFGIVSLRDHSMPVEVEITGWSPFTPGDADNASLPVCALEYQFRNTSSSPAEAVLSFHAANFMATGKDSGASVTQTDNGFLLVQPPTEGKHWDEGTFAVTLLGDTPAVDCAWFRGGWFDALTMVWNHVSAGDAVSHPPHAEGEPGGGGSLYLPFTLKPGEARTVRLLLAWYVPKSDLRVGADQEGESCGSCCCGKEKPRTNETYVPWYAGRFASIDDVIHYWQDNYASLRAATQAFTDCFYDTTLPPEVVEAVAANLTILKSPTCLRQADGRCWGWEGCCDGSGCCSGTCTHVWNYAQALPHLFPALERSLRETEFLVSQDASGHQAFRASLPIRPPVHDFHAAADGQLGGIVKVFREWRISGDTDWLRDLWPKVRESLDYCIGAWDPDRTGTLLEPHHNTYDIEFWGADGMCTSFYLSALHAAAHMGRACGDDVRWYEELLARGKAAMETILWNGEYFNQQVQWKGLHTVDPTAAQAWNTSYSPEARELLEQEGPKYQYGNGCLSDGVLGDWLARVSGLETVLDPAKVTSHVASIFKFNFRESLADHANPQRPSYAFGQEAGLLLCSWPHGGELSLPFVYSNEVWTGIEYQVAAHLMMMGKVEEGLQIVRAVRNRYDGRFRNPFNEYECGHWYARAMSSYSLLQALTGARYDAVETILYLDPRVPDDFRTFLATATGYATVGLRDGKPFVDVKSGAIEINQIVFAGQDQEVM